MPTELRGKVGVRPTQLCSLSLSLLGPTITKVRKRCQVRYTLLPIEVIIRWSQLAERRGGSAAAGERVVRFAAWNSQLRDLHERRVLATTIRPLHNNILLAFRLLRKNQRQIATHV